MVYLYVFATIVILSSLFIMRDAKDLKVVSNAAAKISIFSAVTVLLVGAIVDEGQSSLAALAFIVYFGIGYVLSYAVGAFFYYRSSRAKDRGQR